MKISAQFETSPHIAVGLDHGLELSWDQYRELGRHAARLGYQSVWTNAANERDAMHICAQWSVASADVVPGGIGTGVSVIPIGYWSPASLASCAATVGEISGGKFVLGVGAGALHYPVPRLPVVKPGGHDYLDWRILSAS
jgi:alkanesulfonate monooxygenase SsuD/methylene tetrahydromethanopterin reductase-like flavin-dependent oxidoreductase (luciferase family)